MFSIKKGNIWDKNYVTSIITAGHQQLNSDQLTFIKEKASSHYNKILDAHKSDWLELTRINCTGGKLSFYVSIP